MKSSREIQIKLNWKFSLLRETLHPTTATLSEPLCIFCANPQAETRNRSLVEMPCSSFSFALTRIAPRPFSVGTRGISVLSLAAVAQPAPFSKKQWKVVWLPEYMQSHPALLPRFPLRTPWLVLPLRSHELSAEITLALRSGLPSKAQRSLLSAALEIELLGIPASPSHRGKVGLMPHPASCWCPHCEGVPPTPPRFP